MNQEQINFCRNEWIPALRSGQYQQTQETLREIDENGNDSYCCLGVCASLFPDVIWVDNEVETSLYSEELDDYFDEVVNRPYAVTIDHIIDRERVLLDETAKSCDVALLDVFGERAGVNAQTMSVPPTNEEYSIPVDGPSNAVIHHYIREVDLAGLNDQGWSFGQIANVIEYICNEWEEYNATAT